MGRIYTQYVRAINKRFYEPLKDLSLSPFLQWIHTHWLIQTLERSSSRLRVCDSPWFYTPISKSILWDDIKEAIADETIMSES